MNFIHERNIAPIENLSLAEHANPLAKHAKNREEEEISRGDAEARRVKRKLTAKTDKTQRPETGILTGFTGLTGFERGSSRGDAGKTILTTELGVFRKLRIRPRTVNDIYFSQIGRPHPGLLPHPVPSPGLRPPSPIRIGEGKHVYRFMAIAVADLAARFMPGRNLSCAHLDWRAEISLEPTSSE
jgi:hypothetical protein